MAQQRINRNKQVKVSRGKNNKNLGQWQSEDQTQRLSKATHIRQYDGEPPECYKVGAHGLLYRWSDVYSEWVRSSVELRKLTRAEDYWKYNR